MPTHGNAFAALVVELEKRLQIDGVSRFLTFPEFSLRIGLSDLLFDAQRIQQANTGMDPAIAQREALLNQEDFSVLVNQIPQVSSKFIPDGRMMWSVYERAISSAILPITEPGGIQGNDSVALDFRRFRDDFRLAERGSVKGDGARYYPTSTLPPDDVADKDAWTRIVLDKERINQRSQEGSPSIDEWLKDRGLLEDVQESGVMMDSLSIEVFPLTLTRVWFTPSLFQSRSWKWNDEPLSDGGNPPRGILQAYIIQIIFARKLEIGLRIKSRPGQPLPLIAMLVSTTGAGSPKPGAPSVPGVTKPQLFDMEAMQVKTLDLRKFAAGVTKDQAGNRSLDISPVSSSLAAFPVPTVFLTEPVVAEINAELSTAQSELTQLSSQKNVIEGEMGRLQERINGIEAKIKRYPISMTKVTIMDKRKPTPRTIVIDLQAERKRLANLGRDLSNRQAELTQKSTAIQARSSQVEDLKTLQGHYHLLAVSQTGPEDTFVLGFVCQRVPKSPDPDPQLFVN